MGKTCSTRGDEICVKGFSRKTHVKEITWKAKA